MQHFSDLDELLETVRSNRSREYLAEALKAYRAGAYKAAVALIWVSVCIDIIEKIRELSAEGDARAKPLEKRLDDIKPDDVACLLAYENNLLKMAQKDLQIISPVEQVLLERIKFDRNISVHPSFFNDGSYSDISPETARSHIVNACNTLLLHAPIKGKILIDKITSRIGEESFPADDEKAFLILSSQNYLGRAQDTVYRNLCVVLLKRMLHDEKLTFIAAEKTLATLITIERLKPEIYKTTIREKLNTLLSNADDKKLKRIIVYINKSPSIWLNIESSNQQRILELIKSLSAEDIVKYKVHRSASNIDKINDALLDRVNSLDATQKLIILTGSPSAEFKQFAIEEFISSGSFGSAYDNGIKYLLPYAEHFDECDLTKIFDGSLKNDAWRGINQILNAGGMDEIFVKLFQSTKSFIKNYKNLWGDFWCKIKEQYSQSFPELEQLLISEKITEAAPTTDQVEINDESIPF